MTIRDKIEQVIDGVRKLGESGKELSDADVHRINTIADLLEEVSEAMDHVAEGTRILATLIRSFDPERNKP